MISIQELGTTILSDKPHPFYVLGQHYHTANCRNRQYAFVLNKTVFHL